jgi:enterochelin esterase family protein
MIQASSVAEAPLVEGSDIVFRIPDPDHGFEAVHLYQELVRPRNGPAFTWRNSQKAWELRLPAPDAWRFEYLIELVHEDGGSEMVPDPTNPLRAPGAFGDKSVVELPGYEAPKWTVADPASTGSLEELAVRSRILKGHLPVVIWSPVDTDPAAPLPLLIAHDGPEYARYSALTVMLDRLNSSGVIPPIRAALVGPIDRNETYSASAAYARAFAHEVLPRLLEAAPTPHGRSMRIGMGASLGALAMLHIHRRNPAAFGGLYLQSGSYFRQRYDSQESGFRKFRRISRFVGEVLTAAEWAHPIDVTLTCGTVEENLHNNRAVATALEEQGYEVNFVENPDGHNWVGWRDTFDPHLVRLITEMWA